jgi:predicted SAM-dependent methyltransferase
MQKQIPILLEAFSRNTLYDLRLDFHFLWVRFLNTLLLKRTKIIKPAARFLNVGCGSNGVPSDDWLNVDGWSSTSVDFTCDLRRPLHLGSQRFEGVFTEHFLEHLSLDQAKAFLRECYRVLKPEGIIRISVPDGELYLRNYFENREWMLARRNRQFNTPMQVVNEVFRQKLEHQYCYDFETIQILIEEMGFIDVQRVRGNDGRCKELIINQKERSFESLIVEAIKPS